MITVEIAGNTNELSKISESWIHEQIKNRQKDGIPVCVRVFIKHENIDILLSSSDCNGSSGGGRATKPKEDQLFALWEKLHLKNVQLNSGNLIGFLKQVRDLS